MPLAAGLMLSFTAALLAIGAGFLTAWFSTSHLRSWRSNRGELASLAALLRQ